MAKALRHYVANRYKTDAGMLPLLLKRAVPVVHMKLRQQKSYMECTIRTTIKPDTSQTTPA